MQEILIWFAAALAMFIVAMLLFAARRPDTFEVSRSMTINAPAERIYPLIANLKVMNTWNPFVQPDPAIKIDCSGPEIGKGAAHSWQGNRNVGEGRIEITDAVAPKSVDMRLLMKKPMKADNSVSFTIAPNGSGSIVTWSMSGRQPFIGKLVTLFINCDSMVGSQFEKGLAKLKLIAET